MFKTLIVSLTAPAAALQMGPRENLDAFGLPANHTALVQPVPSDVFFYPREGPSGDDGPYPREGPYPYCDIYGKNCNWKEAEGFPRHWGWGYICGYLSEEPHAVPWVDNLLAPDNSDDDKIARCFDKCYYNQAARYDCDLFYEATMFKKAQAAYGNDKLTVYGICGAYVIGSPQRQLVAPFAFSSMTTLEHWCEERRRDNYFDSVSSSVNPVNYYHYV